VGGGKQQYKDMKFTLIGQVNEIVYQLCKGEKVKLNSGWLYDWPTPKKAL
jgi:hypothetical protein